MVGSPPLLLSNLIVVTLGVTLGLYGDNGEENGNYMDYRDSIGFLSGL